MRPVITLFLIMLVLAGCDSNPAQQYGDTLIDAKRRAEATAVKADLNAVRTALEGYKAEKGAYPASLAEVSVISRQPLPADRFSYDPATGEIKER